MSELSFEQAQEYLLGTINESISPRQSYKLDRMRHLLAELGDPHLGYPTIHVGGTSGKGSTCTMIASALQAAGKRTGLHTKPHLRSVTERARVDAVPIDPSRFARLLESMLPAIERTVSAGFGRATYYETLLALAFVQFARERVDVAVVEVGLGGRLDGTNVIAPEVTAITSVGYDHTDVLGNTLDAIASEKAGIAKPGVPLVVAEVEPSAARAIEEVAALAGAPVIRVPERARVEAVRTARDGQRFDIVTTSRYRVKTPVLGEFQRTNAATAIVVLEQLPQRLRVTPQAVEAAFATLALPGRMEAFAGSPTVIFDIAHNAEKAAHLAASLRESFEQSRVHFVIAIGESKDARQILSTLAPLAASFTFTSFDVAGRRPILPQQLAEIATSLGLSGSIVPDPAHALETARRRADPDDVVVVTGSTFLVADLRERWDHIATAAG